MNDKVDRKMHEIVTGWGIPDIKELENKNIEFVFDSKKIPNVSECYKNLECKSNIVKFCLYDYENEKIIFSMDFYEEDKRFKQPTGEPLYIKLELLNVNDHRLRGKGIASYYLKKLQEYAIEKRYKCIKVSPCPDAEIFKEDNKENSLSLDELIKFYESRSTKEMPIDITEIEEN